MSHPPGTGHLDRDTLMRRLEQAERRLRRTEAQYLRAQRALESIQSFLPQMPVPFVVAADDRTIVYGNHAMESLVGVRNLLGKDVQSVFASEYQSNNPLTDALASEELERGPAGLVNAAMTQCVARPMALADGRRGVLALFLERTLGRGEMSDGDAHMEKLSALGELISGIAHELNNPLTGVIGFSELLAARNLDEKTSGMIQRVLTEANRCKRIVANLLSFSRKHPSQRCAININDLIHKALDLLNYELRIANIAVRFHADGELPKTVGDPYLLQQVFFNIIHNAQHAMSQGAGPGTLTINAEADGEWLTVTIRDTGPGIPEEIRERVFDPFFTTKAGQGTGLGLSISHKIILNHAGRLEVRNSPEGGAVFSIVLPVIDHADGKQEPVDTATPRLHPPTRTGNILVIDDEQPILDLLAEILSSGSHRVTATQKASEALRVMSAEAYDCIISDIKMPELDGREFYELVRTLRPEMTKKLIFITGDYLNDATAKFMQDSGVPYLKKPFSPDEILAMTNKVLAEKQPGKTPTSPH